MRKEITEEQITELLAGIPRAEEVDQLRAEIERLREEHRAEVEKLRSDNERLREMLLDIAVELRGEEPRIVFQIRKALEGKP